MPEQDFPTPYRKGPHSDFGCFIPRPSSLFGSFSLITGVIVIVNLFLSGCSSPSESNEGALPEAPTRLYYNEVSYRTENQQEANLPTETAAPDTPTPPSPEIQEQVLETGNNLPQEPFQPTPEPLRFVFPTPRQAPVSALRPPLYPIPWAPSQSDHFYFARPTAADEVNWPLWDYRYGGNFFENVIHTGIDIPTPIGTPVLAAGPGKVVWAGYGLYLGNNDPGDPYGLAVTILHDFSYQDERLYTVYAHLNRIDVIRGQTVQTGEVIGLSGATGQVTGAHLHFEVRMGKNDFFTTRNPELWLAPPQGWGVLVGRIMTAGGNTIPQQPVIVRSKSSGQKWEAKTYGKESINSDPVYKENLVISDLPAGLYELKIPYLGKDFLQDIEILPGLVTYITFRGWHGISFDPPNLPGEDFTP
jgi:murein DD-endopeptidase MepM/ murein hydrolase activator NlpD